MPSDLETDTRRLTELLRQIRRVDLTSADRDALRDFLDECSPWFSPMPMNSADPIRRLCAELARRHDYLKRIVEAAHNPNCYQCAEVRRLALEALQPPLPSPDDWAT